MATLPATTPTVTPPFVPKVATAPDSYPLATAAGVVEGAKVQLSATMIKLLHPYQKGVVFEVGGITAAKVDNWIRTQYHFGKLTKVAEE